jgi:hypothetical protein
MITFLCVEVAARAFTRKYYTNWHRGEVAGFYKADKCQLDERLLAPMRDSSSGDRECRSRLLSTRVALHHLNACKCGEHQGPWFRAWATR